MSALLECPPVECWQAVFDDGLPEHQRERLERHLDSCPACQERLDRVAHGQAALLGVGGRAGDPTALPSDPTLSRFLERLYGEKASDPPATADPADLYFLRSADRPGVLGTLGGYEVREVIGQGGMGVVLKAFDPALHRLIAVKVLATAIAGSATARKRFTREAQAAAAVCHDHIVTVHGVYEADGLPYLVMQYVDGESLQARLDRAGPLEVAEVVRIGHQTASALAAAHAQGLIHRDIKPANILLENGLARVKITDFGLARMADDVGLTQAGVVAGTPEYMAPEQARGEQVDPRADLFSLGSVLYACCTGLPPFRDRAPLAVLRRVSDEEPAPVRCLNPDVPAWLEAVIVRLLAKDPADRFQSAAEVAALLEAYLAHLRQPATVAAPELPPSPFNPRTQAGTERHRARRLVPVPASPSLRSVSCAVVALASLAGFLVVLARLLGLGGETPSADPDRAAASLEKLGAKITRDKALEGRPVVGVDLRGTRATDAALKDVAAFPQLQTLDLHGTQVTDAGLNDLAGLTHLRSLELGETRVSNSGLKSLAPLARLETLRLERTAVTDDGLKELRAFPKLGSLSLEGTGVTDAGLKEVGALRNLVALNLGQTQVTDAGLKELAPLTRLEWLGLYWTAVTDAGLKDLALLTHLRDLRVNGTGITDAGLKDLAPLKDLRNLDVQDTAVTDEGLKGLRAAATSGPVPSPAAEPRHGSRSKGWLAAAALLGLVLTLALGVGLYLWQSRRRAATVPAGPPAQNPPARPGATLPSLSVPCPGCGKRLKVKAELAGKTVKCPRCAAAVPVPGGPAGEAGPPP